MGIKIKHDREDKMKYLLLLFVFVSCKDEPIRKVDWLKESNGRYNYDYTVNADKYRPKFNAYYDSGWCAAKCNNVSQLDRFSDSLHRYYALMYPNGNPANYAPKPTIDEPNCNCK
jgi:hypothetical protein